ncbi:hypothetical protein D3C75_1004520 [compost metagenome]
MTCAGIIIVLSSTQKIALLPGNFNLAKAYPAREAKKTLVTVRTDEIKRELNSQRHAAVLAKKRSYGASENASGSMLGRKLADAAESCTEPTSIQ